MLGLTRRFAFLIAATMVIVSLAIPHICLADAMPTASEQSVSVEPIDTQQHSAPSKADHGCVSHHCCAGKILPHSAPISSFASASQALLGIAVNENVTGHIPQGLERPPKSIL